MAVTLTMRPRMSSSRAHFERSACMSQPRPSGRWTHSRAKDSYMSHRGRAVASPALPSGRDVRCTILSVIFSGKST